MFGRKHKPDLPAEEKPAPQEAEEKDPLVTQITSLEELVSKRTKDLASAKQQLSDLYETSKGPGEEVDEAEVVELFTQPNQPDGKPAAGQEAAAVLPEAGAEASKQAEEAKEEPSLDFFSSTEEEENPLAGLISSLPEVEATELLAEAQQVTAMIREWQELQAG